MEQCSSNLAQEMNITKKTKMTPTILLPWQHPWFQFLAVKNQISPFATFLSWTRGLPRNRHSSHIVLTLPIRLLGVDDPCVRWNLGILVVIKTGPEWHNCCHGNSMTAVILFLLWCTFLVPSFKADFQSVLHTLESLIMTFVLLHVRCHKM